MIYGGNQNQHHALCDANARNPYGDLNFHQAAPKCGSDAPLLSAAKLLVMQDSGRTDLFEPGCIRQHTCLHDIVVLNSF